MILTDVADGDSVFVDANILVYHFGPHPDLGQPCNDFVRRIETQHVVGYTSTAVLSEVAHQLMTFEASALFGWTSKVVQKLRDDPQAVQQLDKFYQAVRQDHPRAATELRGSPGVATGKPPRRSGCRQPAVSHRRTSR